MIKKNGKTPILGASPCLFGVKGVIEVKEFKFRELSLRSKLSM